MNYDIRSLFYTVVDDMIFNKCSLEINDDHEDKADKECNIKKLLICL